METKTIHNSNISFIEVLAALVEFFILCSLFIIQGTVKTASFNPHTHEGCDLLLLLCIVFVSMMFIFLID